jgi:5-methylcytosine-specific restriction endonuclease McrA
MCCGGVGNAVKVTDLRKFTFIGVSDIKAASRGSKCVFSLKHQILRTDAAGMPLEWVNYRDAVRLYCLGQVAYACGTTLARICGGINAITGLRSHVDLNSIIATYGSNFALHQGRDSYRPPLNNPALFKRDAYLCMYCGEHFRDSDLSRDHVTPLSQRGEDTWNNVVTACKRCNNHKAGRRPEQARMELLAVPFTPTHAEYIYLQGKRVLADQMEFLRAHFPRHSPLHQRLAAKA